MRNSIQPTEVITETKSYRQVQERDCIVPRSYIDNINFNGQQTTTPISVVIPTYNRSPHPVEEDSNPLAWCLESLLTQQHTNLNEIVVVDDNSRDHTGEVVDFFAEQAERKGITTTLIKNEENRGSSISRNNGVAQSKNDLIMFVDDDCVFDSRMLFGATFTLERLPDKVAAIHVPVYHRRRHPKLVNIKDIGVLDLERGIMTGNFDGFPREYLDMPEKHLMSPDLKIFKPIQIQNLGGVFLIKKIAFQEAGGFPVNFTWRNSYREETELALRLAESGYSLFFTPDPKFSSIHLKYGAPEQNGDSATNNHLSHLIDQSNVARIDTGNRVEPVEWFHNVLMSTYVTLASRDQAAAEEYSERMYREFVKRNDFAVSGVGTKIKQRARRRRIYNSALSDARKFIVDLRTA